MNKQTVFVTLAVCATAIAIAAINAGAGPLTPPPGPVAPTPVIEPRILVNAANTPGDANSLFKITQPGSYYLAGNVKGVSAKHGIEIEAGGVTLDLNGFELLGVGDSIDGVNVSAFVESGARIHNGSVRGWGRHGVLGDLAAGLSLRDLVVQENGSTGLSLGEENIVVGCVVQSNLAEGIIANDGAMITGCVVRENGGAGIIVGPSSLVSDNIVSFNFGDGVFSSGASTISGNTTVSNSGDGIETMSGGFVLHNTCNGNGRNGAGAGVHATGSGNHIEGNYVANNDRGIDTDVPRNLVIGNVAFDNGRGAVDNYDISGGTVGPIVTAANIGTSSNPHANYQF